jgi:hypothetical protein
VSSDDTIRYASVDGLKFRELIDVPPYHYAAIFERR